MRRAVHRIPARLLLGHIAGAPLGEDLCAFLAQEPLEGDLVRAEHERTVYLISNGTRRSFASWDAFFSRGHELNQVKVLLRPDYGLYPLGAPFLEAVPSPTLPPSPPPPEEAAAVVRKAKREGARRPAPRKQLRKYNCVGRGNCRS